MQVYFLLFTGPLRSSELCREKSPQHTSFTSSADRDEPAQLILNFRALREVKVRHSGSWVILPAVNPAEFGRPHLSLY